MKILVVGSKEVYSIENIYVRNLQDLGADVTQFPAQSIFFNYYQHSLVNKLLFKAGISGIYKSINNELLALAKAGKPDIIWVFKGMEIYPKTLRQLKENATLLVNFNPDNPFIFSGSGSGNNNVGASIEHFDLHLTYNLDVKERLEDEYGAKVEILPFGFEYSNDILSGCLQQKEINKVCFLGNPDEFRVSFIKKLIASGIPMDLYGHGWDVYFKKSEAGVYNAVYGTEFWKTLYRYRVQLNYMRPHNLRSHNMRSFEIPGIGGIMLAPRTPDHELYFTDHKEVFLYDNIEDCIGTAKKLLSMASEETDQIRSSAKNRSISEAYDYKSRAKFVLRLFQQRYA
ncbi:glycosyltransferase family protein [Flavihumibacter profundi]|uniref:glycosyltransferase family protein n=1 Tax=Flavihumibacter profundi TaxID=2716883 RepID=UPI001CC5FE7C|nr:glycosyltransferase [Flavihumibacter profundi]MBZ5858001.1 glycosyltransferase [Flavihumibacter profundi]